jgi:DNA polymerase-3 subunit gamma/tau
MLSRHAFNSMLKTLEEPPEHVKFILATTDPQRLPVTVLSRCLQFNLKPLPPPLIAGHLKRVLDAEKIPFEEPALVQISKAAAGSVRDSLSLLDQAIAHGGGRVAATQVAEMLGSVGADLVWPLLERIAEGDGKGAIGEAERIAERSISFDIALEDLAGILHRVALAQAGIDPAPDDADRERVSSMAARLDASRVQVMYQIALLGRRDLALAPDEFAGFSMAILRMLSFGGDSAPARALPKGAEPVATPPPATVANAVAFDGDWPGLVARLNLSGMAGLLARYAELGSYKNNQLELVVPDAHRAYAEKNYLERLRAELTPHFAPGFRLSVRTGATSGSSVAAARSRESEERQANAAAAIEDDPFVRSLVRDFGAEVVPSSVRPPNDGGNGQS